MSFPRLLRSSALFALVLLAVAPALVGCGGSEPADSAALTAKAIADTNTRLRSGAWTLEQFVPATPLEPMLAMLLSSQFNRVVVRFDGQRFVAESPGIHVERGYRISEVKGDQFKLTAVDDDGVAYESVCLFVGEGRIELRSTTAPWQGAGILRRL